MTGRDPQEESRSATPLELFFDLVFVVAVSLASHELLHFLEIDRYYDGVIRYLMVFFAIWWAWMNFTWFATEYDTDDWLYRVATLVQMAGALVMAAGIPDAMNELDNAVLVTGYVIMRMAMVSQWVRAAIQSPDTRQRALRYAVGVTLVQMIWVTAAVFGWRFTLPLFVVGVVLELAVPVFAERAVPPRWHPHHIAERYGLFTIIVLGESVLASLNSVVAALEETDQKGDVIRVAVLGFVVVAAMWWLYFALPQAHLLRGLWDRSRHIMFASVIWGYGHYVIFASAAAVSAGISLEVADVLHHLELSELQLAAAFCVPVVVFVAVVWGFAIQHARDRLVDAVTVGAMGAILLAMVTPAAMEITAATMVALVTVLVRRLGANEPSEPAGPASSTTLRGTSGQHHR